MIVHLCVKIEGEMERIRKNKKTVFDCSVIQAWNELQEAKDQGKTFYSGCDNMKENGRCAGHKD